MGSAAASEAERAVRSEVVSAAVRSAGAAQVQGGDNIVFTDIVVAKYLQYGLQNSRCKIFLTWRRSRSGGGAKSVNAGAGLLANPRQAPGVAFSSSAVGGDAVRRG